MDECAEGLSACSEQATCSNTAGSFTCAFNNGWTGNGVQCRDADECQARTDSCSRNARCNNTAGSFACTCIPGFTGDGQTCADVDECSSSGPARCHAGAQCVNMDGSFLCQCGCFIAVAGVDPCSVAADQDMDGKERREK